MNAYCDANKAKLWCHWKIPESTVTYLGMKIIHKLFIIVANYLEHILQLMWQVYCDRLRIAAGWRERITKGR